MRVFVNTSRWSRIGPISTAILCFSLTGAYEVGGPIHEQLTNHLGRALLIFLDLSFPANSYVTKWSYYASVPGEVVAAVWRPLSNGSYILVAKDYLVARSTGTQVGNGACNHPLL